jgi:hypothetical protein
MNKIIHHILDLKLGPPWRTEEAWGRPGPPFQAVLGGEVLVRGMVE